MNFKLPTNQLETLDAFKELLDSHDKVDQGSKNDQTNARKPAPAVVRDRVWQELDKL